MTHDEGITVQVVAGFLSDNLLSGIHLHLYIPHIANVIGTVMTMIYYHSVEMWNSPRFLLLFMPYWLASTVIEGMKASNLNMRGLSHVYMRPHLSRTSIVLYCLLCLIELDVLRQLVSWACLPRLSFNWPTFLLLSRIRLGPHRQQGAEAHIVGGLPICRVLLPLSQYQICFLIIEAARVW